LEGIQTFCLRKDRDEAGAASFRDGRKGEGPYKNLAVRVVPDLPPGKGRRPGAGQPRTLEHDPRKEKPIAIREASNGGGETIHVARLRFKEENQSLNPS